MTLLSFISLVLALFVGVLTHYIIKYIEQRLSKEVKGSTKFFLITLLALGAFGLTFLLYHLLEGDQRASLYIKESTSGDYYIAGKGISRYSVGDALVVYASTATGIKLPIALLRVTGTTPNALVAQAVLSHPGHHIKPNLEVNDQVDKLSTSDLIPPDERAIGYLLLEGTVRLRPDIEVASGDTLIALSPSVADGKIIDFVSHTPSVEMIVTEKGLNEKVAQVELISGVWPEIGTIITLSRNLSSTPQHGSSTIGEERERDNLDPDSTDSLEQEGTNEERDSDSLDSTATADRHYTIWFEINPYWRLDDMELIVDEEAKRLSRSEDPNYVTVSLKGKEGKFRILPKHQDQPCLERWIEIRADTTMMFCE